MERWPNEKFSLLKTLINMPRKQKDIRYSEENTQQGYSTDDMTDEEIKPQIKPIIEPKRSVFKAERPLTSFSSVNEEEAHQKEICLNQLVGVCPERHCQNHHTTLPYLWQIHMFGKWVSFDNNQMLEERYCNLEDSARGKVYIADNEWDIILHFEKGHGSCKNDSMYLGPLRIRRLSTGSFGKEKEPPPGGSFHTQWRWYFRNDWHKWELFEKDELQHTLEKKYTKGQKSYLFTRESHKFKYRISFSDWTQTNIDTGKGRKIMRRPVFISATEVRLRQFPRTLHISCLDPYPPEWNALDLAHEFELVELEETNREFDSVKTEFFATLREKNFKISNIYRIQNLALWNEYKMKRLNLEKIHARKAGSLEERSLFHGTDSYDTCYGICTNNFDFRLSGKNATVYGKGSYFAVSAKYSHNYTKGPVHLMFRAKVLIGSYTAGKHDMTCPPNIPGEGHRRYDTCVDNVANPSIFVVFDRNQCYPEYLIAYRQTAETTGILKSTPSSRINPPVSGSLGVQPAWTAHSHSTSHQNQSHTATVGTRNNTSQSTANVFQSSVDHYAGARIGAAKSSPSLASSTGSSPSIGSSSGFVSHSVTTAHPQNTTQGSLSVRNHSSASDDSQTTNSGNRLFNNRGNNATITSIRKKKDTCSIQ
uniref:Poly [ADP-ribose] polymerase n=1 Tax=Crassostrea virginica TaxID=6565 RepID=A0A8B8ELJ5_CRAVI|nr:poly [ADP-ribose] polymerase 12-like isoform X3 [Crassostrea virginica]